MSERALDVGDVFDDWAARGRGEGMETGHRLTAGHVVQDLGLQPGDRMLDMGTGIGWAVRDAAEQGALAIGVDVAPAMLDKARERALGEPRAGFVRAIFEALPFPEATFAAAFSMEALYYADELEPALAETVRVLEPGGQLHVLIDFYQENEASHGWPELTGVEMHLLSEAGWIEVLETAGFDHVQANRLRSKDQDAEAWKREEGSLYLRASKPPTGSDG